MMIERPNADALLSSTPGGDAPRNQSSVPVMDRGPIPMEQHPGYAWPTWREALGAAQRGIDTAYDHRARTFKAANDVGISLADIGSVVGLSAAGVHKIIGGARIKATLDDPVGVEPVKDNPDA